MPYDYKEMRSQIFLEENQWAFLQFRNNMFVALRRTGAVQLEKLMSCGDSWLSIAFFDRMVELGEIREIPQVDIAGQDRIFVPGPKFPKEV